MFIMNFFEKRQEFMDNLSAAREGKKNAHVWRSPLSQYMQIVILDKGEPINTDFCAHSTTGLGRDFVEDTDTYYGGHMSADEIDQRLQDMKSLNL